MDTDTRDVLAGPCQALGADTGTAVCSHIPSNGGKKLVPLVGTWPQSLKHASW